MVAVVVLVLSQSLFSSRYIFKTRIYRKITRIAGALVNKNDVGHFVSIAAVSRYFDSIVVSPNTSGHSTDDFAHLSTAFCQ